MCKTGTEGEEMLGKKSLVQSTTQERPPCWGASCLQEKAARFAAQATMTALLRFTTQWRQHAEVRSDLHLVRSFTGEPMPGKGLQGFRTERSSAFQRLSGFTSVSSWPLYSDTPVTGLLKDGHHLSFSRSEMYFLPSGHPPIAAVPLLCQMKFLLRHPHVSLQENTWQVGVQGPSLSQWPHSDQPPQEERPILPLSSRLTSAPGQTWGGPQVSSVISPLVVFVGWGWQRGVI